MNLPLEFTEKLKLILKEKYDLFLKNFDSEPFRAMRINALKADKVLLKTAFDFLDEPTPFCENSYYVPNSLAKLGNHPLHHAGAFYMQEPSATSVVSAIGINEGDFVLDLCASPGGKTTQAAALLNGTGFLLANEYISSRASPLISNIERMGIPNAAVTSVRPDILCDEFYEYFDKVIVDAPCSGEGMFRKESEAIKNWSLENVIACANRQKKILDSAARTVKKGGKLVYSTCTYSYEENEQVIEYFLKNHNDFRLVLPCNAFGEDAVSDFAKETENINFARRIFNFNGGEGHFVAVMQKCGESSRSVTAVNTKYNKNDEQCIKIFTDFYLENFETAVPNNVVCVGDKVYITTNSLPDNKIKPIRNGIFAGVCKNGRFVPEHALFNNSFHVAKRIIDLPYNDDKVLRFLHGEEIPCDNSLKGYVQIKVNGVPLGFGKASNGTLKNHYPKGLRIL